MERIRIETNEHGCRTIWLNRPEKRNALDQMFLRELLAAAEGTSDDEAVRMVIIRSTSPIFCAGADITELTDVTPRIAQTMSALGSRAFRAIADIPVPVAAVMEGGAFGGGLEMAMACDIRLATTACRFGFPEPRLGNSPAWGGMTRMVEAVGPARARDMLLTGDVFDAEHGFRTGVIQRICKPEDLDAQLEELIASVLACDTGTLAYLKALLGGPAHAVAAQEAAIAGFAVTRPESRKRKEQFLASRRKPA